MLEYFGQDVPYFYFTLIGGYALLITKGSAAFILSKEGITQGDSLGMKAYGIGQEICYRIQVYRWFHRMWDDIEKWLIEKVQKWVSCVHSLASAAEEFPHSASLQHEWGYIMRVVSGAEN